MLTIKYGNGDISVDFQHYFKEDVGWYIKAEKNTQRYFISNIKPEFNIIDAGAQIGMYSILFSKLAKNGTVHCFEPTDTIELLQKNTEYNNCNNVKLHKIALSNKDGDFEDKIYKQWSQKLVESKKFTFSSVDNFVKKNQLSVDLIKIDVDSYDYEVLLGCQNLLTVQSPIVMVELNSGLNIRGYSLNQAIDYMNSVGYKVDQILDHENYIFIKN